MALIEYDIQYADGQPKVTCKVVQVDKDDRILFKSDSAKAAIRYVGQSPFRGGHGPQADEIFKVGQDAGPFDVTVPTFGKPRQVQCGEMQTAQSTTGGSFSAQATTEEFKVYPGAGFDTP